MPWNNTVVDSQILAVHAALVPTGPQGEVVLFGGDEHWRDQQESEGGDKWKKTRLYDVASHTLVGATIPSPDSDVFCSHHAFAADGRLLIAGGTWKWPADDAHGHALDFLGHRRCWLYHPRGRRWVEVASLNRNPDQPDENESGGRWYPGLVTLGSGDVLATFGHAAQEDARHRNTLPERYNQAANTWVNLPKQMAEPHPPNGNRPLFYARTFTLPDGKVFFATPMPVDFATAPAGQDGPYFSTRYDPATGDYVGHKIPQPGAGGYRDWSRPAVLLPLLPEEQYRPRVLFCGETEAIRIDLGDATGEWQGTGNRDPSVSGLTRVYSNAVVLPTGKVCLVGGMDVVGSAELGIPEEPVNKAETYDPGIDWGTGTYAAGTGTWSVDADEAAHNRNYHSTALLLPNGKVWVAGGNLQGQSGNPDSVGVKRIELYEPDYVAVGGRMQITAPSFVSYGESFEIGLDRPATNVSRVALIRAGSVTHSTNNDQRYVGLAIQERTGNTVRVTAPPNGNVAPPGYYMLWAVDTNGNPCQLARFVRLAHVGCTVWTDRSTFSQEEIESLGAGGQATINNAILVYFDGFLDAELTGAPTFALTWADTNDPVPVSQLTLVPGGRLLETGPGDPDVPQRVTFAFHVRFEGTAAFSSVVDERQVRATFTLGVHSCSETIDLTKAANPYMTDVDPAVNNPGWLSTDVRVFATAGGHSRAGVVQGNGWNDGRPFIRGILDEFNSTPESGSHPFLAIPADQQASPLILWTDVFGIRLFNYAVAKVRYRATTTVAQKVKVFFRLFNTVGTALAYDKDTTYRHSGPGPNTVPLLGRVGGELVSIPFFVSERVETVQGQADARTMRDQPLDGAYEVKDISPTPGTEVTMYFGAWLDFNRTRERYPRSPGNDDGPWPASSTDSIQQLVRGRHQCLVAEVYFEPDTTDANETPGTSDNLSQRNVAILFSDNPGSPDSHTVLHTFEVKPSSLPKLPPEGVPAALPLGTAPAMAGIGERRFRPDELFFRWYNLPPDTEVTLFFSDVDTRDVMRLAALRLSPVAFTAVDKHTISFRVEDATYLPLPGGRAVNIPALLSVRLPDTVVYGQDYRVSVQQIDGPTQQVIGAFEIAIPVSKKELIVDDERRTYSVMKHIATKIPPMDRWYKIFQLYLHGLGVKLDALGVDPGSVHGNPDGSGEPYVPPDRPEDPEPSGGGGPSGGTGPSWARHCLEAWAVSLVLVLTLTLLGVIESAGARGVIVAVAVVALVLLIRAWSVRCCGHIRCALLDHVLLGSAVAAGVLAILLAADVDTDFLAEATAIAAAIAGLAVVLSFAFRCRGGCCDEVEPECEPEAVSRTR